MVIWMHLVLINNNTTVSCSDEKTLSSFLLYLCAYSLDGVSIGTATAFFFSPPFHFFLVLLIMKLQTHICIFFFPSLFRRRALGRSMLDNDDDDHFACNLYCFLFFLLVLWRVACSLAKLTFFSSLVRSPPHTYTSKTILDMCKAVIFLFFPVLFDGKRERVCLTFLLFCSHCCLLHYSHICVRM